jgi:hypothetical protein
LGGDLLGEDEEKDEKGGKEGEAKEELEADGTGLVKARKRQLYNYLIMCRFWNDQKLIVCKFIPAINT